MAFSELSLKFHVDWWVTRLDWATLKFCCVSEQGGPKGLILVKIQCCPNMTYDPSIDVEFQAEFTGRHSFCKSVSSWGHNRKNQSQMGTKTCRFSRSNFVGTGSTVWAWDTSFDSGIQME